jgi:thiol-disulfide isomerase/thioredoxin
MAYILLSLSKDDLYKRRITEFPLVFIYLILALSFLISSCQAQQHSSITGNIVLHSGWKPKAYLIQPGQFNEIVSAFRGSVIDSAEIKSDGSFAFKPFYSHSEKTLLLIAIQKSGNRFPNELMDDLPAKANYIPFILKTSEEIKLSADTDNFQESCTFQLPSIDNQAIVALRDIRIKAFATFQSNQIEDIENDTLLLEKEDIYMAYVNKMMEFADTTSCFEAALLAIRWISPVGDYERMPEFLFGQCQKWNALYFKNPFTKQLCTAADKDNLPVLIGDVFPDFQLPLSDGGTLPLKQLIGKKLTLVDIWASWCAPCRKENREVLLPLWNKYKDDGLQIIAYSIDNDQSSWVEAIRKDDAAWLHASHLTGDATPFMNAIRITTIPANFILDGEGKIIAKNLYGDALKDFVKAQLQ